MHQFLLGASFPFVIGLAVYAARRFRADLIWLVITPLLTVICGAWAIVPDIPRLIGWTSLYVRMAQWPGSDVFFWHYTIDLSERESAWYQAGYVVILAAFLLIAWREVARRENRQGRQRAD
jgi:hypothetical protein